MAVVEIVLEQRDGRWIGRGEGLEAEAPDLFELDELLRRGIEASGRFPAGERVEVFQACDRRMIPPWMRPYHSHYFNRTFAFVVGEEAT